jgi:MFS superfamily sulfate permease-like transporter
MAQNGSAKANAAWPIFRSLASFRPSYLPGDLIAGLTLAAIAIPEQMATAPLGGFSSRLDRQSAVDAG